MANELAVLCKKWRKLSRELFHQDYLHSQFSELQNLVGGSQTERDIVRLFFKDTEKTLDKLRRLLEQHQPDHPVNFRSLRLLVDDLKGYSACVGAQRVKVVCQPFLNSIHKGDRESCIRSFHLLTREFYLLKGRLETFYQLEESIVEAQESV